MSISCYKVIPNNVYQWELTMAKVYKVVDPIQPGTSTHSPTTDWSKCVLCQDNGKGLQGGESIVANISKHILRTTNHNNLI